MVFGNTQMNGMNLGFPDVCNTPTPAGPVPIPYPNISNQPLAVPFVPNIFHSFAPTQNMLRAPTISNGDNAGAAMGVASGMVMGPTKNMTGCFTTLVGGGPMTKMLDVTGQNGMSPNAVGATLVPSQVRVMYLK